jgi:acetyl esterase/lipase
LLDSNRDKVLLNLHGGGFNSDSGSFTESIPIAGYSKIKLVAVLYRLALENPFPAAVDDSVAVYKELLKIYRPNHIVIYGTSAGAILTAEVAARLKQLGLPLPAALGIFSGMGDFARAGDSVAVYSLRGFSGHLDPPRAEGPFMNTPLPQTFEIQCSRRSSLTCVGCRQRSLSPAAATCYSPGPSTFTALTCTPASMRA